MLTHACVTCACCAITDQHRCTASLSHVRAPAGAQLREWYLGGTASGQMQLTATLRLLNVTAEATAAGLAASFVQELPEGRDPAELELIFAAGAVFGNGGMR